MRSMKIEMRSLFGQLSCALFLSRKTNVIFMRPIYETNIMCDCIIKMYRPSWWITTNGPCSHFDAENHRCSQILDYKLISIRKQPVTLKRERPWSAGY